MTRGLRNWLILALIVVLFAVAYALAGFVGVPRLVRSQLLSFVSENYGRQATIGEIRFNPFTFVLEAHDFNLPDRDRQPEIAFGRLHLDLDVATIWRAAPSFGAIEIDRPFVRTVIRRDGSLNLAELAKPFEDDTSEEPTRLFVDRFSVTAGQARFEDRSRATPFQALLRPIAFELRDFSTTGKTANAYSLTGASTAGERFSWNGTFSVEPLASRGRFEVTDLHARTVWSYLQDALRFEMSSGEIDLNGEYTLAASRELNLGVDLRSVSVTDLGLRPRGQANDYVQHANLQIDGTRLDLAKERVDVGRILLSGGTVRAWRDEKGAINLMELVPPPGQQPGPDSGVSTPAPKGVVTESSWALAAPEIAVENFRVELEDRMVKPAAAFTLAPINVAVRGFTNAPNVELDVDAQIGINKAGELAAKAKVTPDSGAVAGHVDLKDFDLAAIQPYVNTYTQITLLSGALSTKLDVALAADGALDLKGATEVTKLRAIDNALRQDLVKWDQLRLEGLHLAAGATSSQSADSSSAPKSAPALTLRIDTLVARAPYARLIIAPDQTLNLTKALSPSPGSTPAAVQAVQTASGEQKAPGGNPGAMQMSIGTVTITNGSANFADFWIQPNYAVSLQGLNGTIAGLSSDPKSRAKVALEGKVDRYAPAQINGEINLLSAALFTDMKVSFKGVEMTSVTPYSGRFAGYKIEKGKLSIDVEYRVEDRKLDAKQRFVVDQLQLGERVESADAVKLPLRLAVALLKDRNGVIDLNLPLSGSLDDPKFRLGPIIWKAFVGLLTKVATAPFALLGSLFGGGEEINRIDFAPGTATLDATAQERLTSVAKALKERPQLQLDVPMPYSPEADGTVLTAQKVNEKLATLVSEQEAGRKQSGTDGNLDAVMADPAKKFELLHTQYQLDYGKEATPPAATAAVLAIPKKKREPTSFDAANEELTQAITQKQTVSEPDLEQLAQARAHAVQDALLSAGELDASRVFILGAKATPPADGKVRLELSLK